MIWDVICCGSDCDVGHFKFLIRKQRLVENPVDVSHAGLFLLFAVIAGKQKTEGRRQGE